MPHPTRAGAERRQKRRMKKRRTEEAREERRREFMLGDHGVTPASYRPKRRVRKA